MSNQFIYGRPVSGDEFVGYDAELQSVFNRIRQGDSSAIVGDPHVGKTSLLIQLEKPDIQKKYMGDDVKPRLIIKYIDLLAIEDDYDSDKFWFDVLSPLNKITISSVKNQLGICHEKKYDGRELEKFFSLLKSHGRLLVITLDEFECLLSHPNFKSPSFYGLLRSLITRVGGLCVIISSRLPVIELIKRGRSILDVGSPFFQMANFYLPPFDYATVQILLNRAIPQFSRREKDFIYRVSGPNPYLLQAMAAAFSETSKKSIGREIEVATESFFNRVSYHFDDVWSSLDDSTKTVAVILMLKDLDGRALGNSYNYGEIERVDRFGVELNNLKIHGLARLVEKTDKLIFDPKFLLVWRGERWAMTSQSFSWWILRNVITHDREIPSVETWLKQHKYIGIVTQKQWEDVKSLFQKMPSWAIRGIAGLARSLWDEISRK